MQHLDACREREQPSDPRRREFRTADGRREREQREPQRHDRQAGDGGSAAGGGRVWHLRHGQKEDR
jgi:hypothetical protein